MKISARSADGSTSGRDRRKRKPCQPASSSGRAIDRCLKWLSRLVQKLRLGRCRSSVTAEQRGRKIADALQTDLHLAEKRPVKNALTANAEASELYLRGQYLLNKRTAESIQQARQFFEQAVAKDADFALGHAGIAEAYILLGRNGVLPVEEAANRAWPEVSAALRLDDKLAEGYLSRAILLADFQWKWDAAEMDYRKAIKLNPNNARAHHWFALNLAQLGRAKEALQEIGIAQKLDPLAPIIPAARAKILLTDHRFKEAVAESQKALELEPDFAPAYSVLAQALAFQGQYGDAIAAARKYVDLTGGGDQELLEARLCAGRCRQKGRGTTNRNAGTAPRRELFAIRHGCDLPRIERSKRGIVLAQTRH